LIYNSFTTAAREKTLSPFQFGGRVFFSNTSNLEAGEKHHLKQRRVSISIGILQEEAMASLWQKYPFDW
jgi:hypothetical protein